jgi:glucokinase
MYYVGIDLGGTNIAVGVCNENYEIIATASRKTNCPRPCEEICADMAKTAEEAVKNAGLTMDDIAAIGIGAPGAVNPETGVIFIKHKN